jgi:hypothetical protein
MCSPLAFKTQELLTSHLKSHHQSEALTCKMCKTSFNQMDGLKKHICQNQEMNPKTNCDQCDFRGESVNDFVKHLLETHERNTEMIECRLCNHRALTIQNINDHIETDHVEFTFLEHLLSNQKGLYTNLDTFKSELTNILNTIIDSHNAIKQELFILRQDRQENKEKIGNIEKVVTNVSNALSSGKVPTLPKTPASVSTSTASLSSDPETSVPQPSRPSVIRVNAPNNMTTEKPLPKQSKQSKQQPKPKILFVGDSISGHADIKVIADATHSKVVTTKAYSAVHDEVSNEAKEAAFFPKKNFLHVVPNEVIKDNYEHVIVQAGSVDITNLKTDVNPKKYSEYFKQEAVMSATNIFNSCVLALERQPALKSVVILKQTPRYDPLDIDPLGLKPALSQLFNNTLVDRWLSSPLKNKIFIGSHNIDCSVAIQAARYRHTKTGRFDGVHLSSDDDYHLSCAQFKYQNKQSRYQGN